MEFLRFRSVFKTFSKLLNSNCLQLELYRVSSRAVGSPEQLFYRYQQGVEQYSNKTTQVYCIEYTGSTYGNTGSQFLHTLQVHNVCSSKHSQCGTNVCEAGRTFLLNKHGVKDRDKNGKERMCNPDTIALRTGYRIRHHS